MGVEVEGRVGPINAGDGNKNMLRLGKQTEQIIQQAHGQFYESASRGVLFLACTAVTGVAPGTAFGVSAPMEIWNPSSSGILVSIKQVFVGYISGTLGAGTMHHGVNFSQPSAPTGGTAITPVATNLSNSSGKAKAYTNATLSNTPSILRPSIVLGAALATSVQFPSAPPCDDVQGAIVIPPGVAWVYQGVAAAGTSPLVTIGVLFEEIPLVG